MSAADQKFDQAADKVQEFANRMAGEEGPKSKLADPLAEDADLIRRMKPSMIKARMKGEAPTDQKPAETATIAPAAPRPAGPAATKQKGERKGPNPWMIVGVALAAGIVLARFIEWRGHGYPRD
jgi:hypothetical protein